jgi:hypothetical protein
MRSKMPAQSGCVANGSANETVRDGGDATGEPETDMGWVPRSVRCPRPPETRKTCVVCLITQRSQVQILPPLPVSAGQMPDRRKAVRLFDRLLAVRWWDGTPERGTLRGGLAWIGIAAGCWRDVGHRELPAAASVRDLVWLHGVSISVGAERQ